MMAGLHIRRRVKVVNISEAVQEADSILAMAVSSVAIAIHSQRSYVLLAGPCRHLDFD